LERERRRLGDVLVPHDRQRRAVELDELPPAKPVAHRVIHVEADEDRGP
jgi:hypothetical protein